MLAYFSVQVLLVFVLVESTNAIRGDHRQGQVARSSLSSSSSDHNNHNDNIQRLHEELAIDTSDPREDIRTNRLLNMEGF
jgi:hypothetical protein